MGAIQGEWCFPPGAAPEIEALADLLRRGMGLDLELSHDGKVFTIDIPALKQGLFNGERAPDRISCCGFLPPHPYLWVQVDRVMTRVGAISSAAPFGQPGAKGPEFLRRPWRELTASQRLALRWPPIGTWRPLDFLILKPEERRW